MSTEMLVKGVALDPVTSTHLVILKNSEQTKSLTICIGLHEANAIITEIGNIKPPRPMTHDLLKNTIEALGGTICKVNVIDLVNNTYYATIEIAVDGKIVEVDSRPSDAIALALKFDAPIVASEKVLQKSKLIEIDEDEEESKKWKEFLENLSPSDFGKYTI